MQGATLFLLALAAAATLAIWSADPLIEWAYEGGVFLLAGWVASGKEPSLRADTGDGGCAGPVGIRAACGRRNRLSLCDIERVVAGGGAGCDRSGGFRGLPASEGARPDAAGDAPWFAWFGFVLSIVSVVAYYTSPGSILWLFPSPYPDVWGPFLSRNNFAQFLELALPVSSVAGVYPARDALSVDERNHARLRAGVGIASGRGVADSGSGCWFSCWRGRQLHAG